MSRYILSSHVSQRRMLDNHGRVFVDVDDFWYVDRSCGDIVTLGQILTHHEETEPEGPGIVMMGDMSLKYESRDKDEPFAVPARDAVIPPIQSAALVITDHDGRTAAEYRVGNRWVDVRFDNEHQRVNFLSPMQRDYITLKDLEGDGNDDKRDKLKRFMVSLLDAFHIWED